MDISRHVQELQDQLVETTELAGEQAAEIARQLSRSLDSTLRMVLLEALSEAAGEITAELAPGSVDVRLRGRDPEFVVTPPTPPAESVGKGVEQAPSADYAVDGRATRTTLRLPDSLKTKAEAAAAREGMSVNSWLVRAVAAALSDQSPPSPMPPGGTGTRFTGWVR